MRKWPSFVLKTQILGTEFALTSFKLACKVHLMMTLPQIQNYVVSLFCSLFPTQTEMPTHLKSRIIWVSHIISHESNIHNTTSHFRLLTILLFVENTFVNKHEFMKIRTADDWWRWAHTTLISEAKVSCSAVIILTTSCDGQ